MGRTELANHDGVGQCLEIDIARDELRPVALRRRIDERVRHRQTVRQGDVRSLERQRFVDRGNRRAAQGGDRFDGTLLREVPTEDLVDLIDLDGADEQGLSPLDVPGKTICSGSVGEVLDPAAGVDQYQSRSFFSRRRWLRAPLAIPR